MPSIVSITSPVATTALTTVANAKLDLGLTNAVDDSYIANLIVRASAIITRYCGRDLGKQTLVETFRKNYVQYLWNPYPPGYGSSAQTSATDVTPLVMTFVPTISISSIVEDGGSPLVAGTDYEFEPRSGLLWRLSSGVRWYWPAMATVVSYQSGFVLPTDSGTRTLPYEIEDVCLNLVRSGYYARGFDPAVVMELVEGVGRTQYNRANPTSTIQAMALDDGMIRTLAPYRSMVW